MYSIPFLGNSLVAANLLIQSEEVTRGGKFPMRGCIVYECLCLLASWNSYFRARAPNGDLLLPSVCYRRLTFQWFLPLQKWKPKAAGSMKSVSKVIHNAQRQIQILCRFLISSIPHIEHEHHQGWTGVNTNEMSAVQMHHHNSCKERSVDADACGRCDADSVSHHLLLWFKLNSTTISASVAACHTTSHAAKTCSTFVRAADNILILSDVELPHVLSP